MFTLMNLVATPHLKVVTQLCKDPMREYYQRELAIVSKVSVGLTNQFLRELTELQFVTQEKRGKMNFYKLNLKNPVVRQFKILLNVDSLHELIQTISTGSRKVILFGSTSQGTDAKESDVDLFILTSEKDWVRRKISEFNSRSKRKIAPIIVDANGFVKLKRDDKPLYENIGSGIILWQTTE
ncbi:nucleotidyltransferase domain-containing protein [Candidatus Peregrinibacteria bacterium]|nr:nucleotidyltransferase domain-containing protein [Candidatus Peregrinibacteria bacterium]